jgi:hypothetical protein
MLQSYLGAERFQVSIFLLSLLKYSCVTYKCMAALLTQFLSFAWIMSFYSPFAFIHLVGFL